MYGRGAREPALLTSLGLAGFRGYASLRASFGPGPQLIWGPNAAGKTSLIEAIVLAAWGRSHRTSTDAELIRWGDGFARVEADLVRDPGSPDTGLAGTVARGERTGGDVIEAGAPGGRAGGPTNADRPAAALAHAAGTTSIEVALAREGPSAGRKRVKVNGVPRRAGALAGALRVVVFAPEEMLLVVGPPSLRRAALDQLATERAPGYGRALQTYGRALHQRNGLLKAIRDGSATRDQLRFWDATLVEAGGEIVVGRRSLLDALAEPLARAHREIAPEEGPLSLAYLSNAAPLQDETPRDALARRLAETAERELWQGTTLVGPHRDDLSFILDGREAASSASRGQQRTAILALKLAELDLLAELDGRPPLLLLDDVFSELDPARRSHLVRRIAALPQAFVTTTTLEDLDPELRAIGAPWRVDPPDGGSGSARLVATATAEALAASATSGAPSGAATSAARTMGRP